ncbi:hypothetical protein NPIL_548111 [Nephila pilipes]|uniref:Uncharacterized protein n=1 Tax=Nephila pilipes TaxID=299642 RepID=A0A8X6PUQ3_NEPPI|nr:hypothetical protein NPIL_548111 [Nephila pilipes]
MSCDREDCPTGSQSSCMTLCEECKRHHHWATQDRLNDGYRGSRNYSGSSDQCPLRRKVIPLPPPLRCQASSVVSPRGERRFKAFQSPRHCPPSGGKRRGVNGRDLIAKLNCGASLSGSIALANRKRMFILEQTEARLNEQIMLLFGVVTHLSVIKRCSAAGESGTGGVCRRYITLAGSSDTPQEYRAGHPTCVLEWPPDS